MTTVFRIAKKKYTREALSGNGGMFVGGRWHRKGVRIVYCAQSLSLATLEHFVHFGCLEKAIELVAFDIQIPDALIEDCSSSLPADWSAVPASSSTADIGDAWIASARSAVLKVPSALTPGEFNFLLNPAHADASKVNVVAINSFTYDSRLWK